MTTPHLDWLTFDAELGSLPRQASFWLDDAHFWYVILRHIHDDVPTDAKVFVTVGWGGEVHYDQEAAVLSIPIGVAGRLFNDYAQQMGFEPSAREASMFRMTDLYEIYRLYQNWGVERKHWLFDVAVASAVTFKFNSVMEFITALDRDDYVAGIFLDELREWVRLSSRTLPSEKTASLLATIEERPAGSGEMTNMNDGKGLGWIAPLALLLTGAGAIGAAYAGRASWPFAVFAVAVSGGVLAFGAATGALFYVLLPGRRRRQAGAIAVIAGLSLSALLVAPVLIPHDQTPVVTATPLPFAAPDPNSVVQVTALSVEDQGHRTYVFHYDIRNDGPPACLWRAWVIVHRHQPASPVYFPDGQTQAPVCLQTGETHSVAIKRRLASGTYGLAAKWSNAADSSGKYVYYCYAASTDCDPELDGREITVP